jgi:two-component system nitrate/nitrite sensor histidine kinase NarX
MPTEQTDLTNHRGRRSLLIVVGALMSFILALGLTAMASALLIADLTQGMAAAVNQSGTLRMQSYRVGLALADGAEGSAADHAQTAQLAAGLAQRLEDPKLTNVIPVAPTDPVRRAYTRIHERWTEELLPAIQRGAGEAYLREVDGFVDDVHDLVRLLESRTERRIRLLWIIQSTALGLTLISAVFTMLLLRRRVLRPLQILLQAAEQARMGNFSTRTPFVGTDELGRLGTAMNLMSQGLSELYGQLETRVARKTRDLERSNRSLRLLYRSAQSLDGARLSEAGLHAVLGDLRDELGLSAVRLCLREGWGELDAHQGMDERAGARDPVGDVVSDPGVVLSLNADCDNGRCPGLCPEGASPGDDQPAAPVPGAVPFVIADQQARYGTLWVVPDAGLGFADWQRPVLESWTKQLATALNLRGRLRETRRLILHEERSILARELHDSLAQSLSYLKIQAMRLEQALAARRGSEPRAPAASGSAATPEIVVADLRDGINSAYRHLRELLTSFRLKIDGAGLRAAIQSAVAECEAQSALQVERDDRLASDLLSPHQEVHVLQIVREALSNVRRHARASRVRVGLREVPGHIEVEVADDGVGIGEPREPWGHHGLNIMQERARSLGGTLDVVANQPKGTLIRLRFPARAVPLEHAQSGNRQRTADNMTTTEATPP